MPHSLTTVRPAEADSSAAYTWFFLALTHDRLGNVDEARQWYEKAAAWTSEVLAPAYKDGKAKPSVAWNRRLTLELLQSEVSEMLATPLSVPTSMCARVLKWRGFWMFSRASALSRPGFVRE